VTKLNIGERREHWLLGGKEVRRKGLGPNHRRRALYFEKPQHSSSRVFGGKKGGIPLLTWKDVLSLSSLMTAFPEGRVAALGGTQFAARNGPGREK